MKDSFFHSLQYSSIFNFSLSGKELQFLLSHNGEKIFEVLQFKEETRSWFVEDSVQQGPDRQVHSTFTIIGDTIFVTKLVQLIVVSSLEVYVLVQFS